ncbi:MAG: hypothetical protein U0835_16805 [Isosphaeraceae bacterium]
MIDAEEALERFRKRFRLPGYDVCLPAFAWALFALMFASLFWPYSDVPLWLVLGMTALFGVVAAAVILFAVYVMIFNTFEWIRERTLGPAHSSGDELWDHWIDEYPG